MAMLGRRSPVRHDVFAHDGETMITMPGGLDSRVSPESTSRPVVASRAYGHRPLYVTLRDWRIRSGLVVAIVLLVCYRYWFTVFHIATYGTRPLWDSAGAKRQVENWQIIDFLGFADPETSCPAHNMTVRKSPIRFFDIFLFSNELDLLELHLFELDPFVDKFVLIESPCFFNGDPKPLVFQAAKKSGRFDAYLDKIQHVVFSELDCESITNLKGHFAFEGLVRSEMKSAAQQAGLEKGDLVMVSDVDEIPRRDVIHLLKACDGWPGSRIQLQLRRYLYSFEFRELEHDIASAVTVYGDGQTPFSHSRQSDILLGEAGWHCSWCFRTIEEIVQKMVGYSHNDRLDHQNRDHLTSYAEIFRKSCAGKDPFGYLPESYSFKQLIANSGGVPRVHGLGDAPLLLQRAPMRFKPLLPGHCHARALPQP